MYSYFQVGAASVEKTLRDFKFLNSDIQIIAIWKLIGGRGNAGAVVHSVCVCVSVREGLPLAM